MEFEKQKKDVLGREDKSIIGGIDPRILGLVNLVNSLDDYYTTSSCSGRLGLLHRIARGKNKGMEWVFKSHEPLALEAGQGVSVLRGYFNKGEELWLRQEPLILHVCCRDVECARRLMAAAQNAGFKRPGIIAAGRRVIVEIKTDSIINAPVLKGEFSADDIQLGLLLSEADLRLEENFKKIKRLEKEIKNLSA